MKPYNALIKKDKSGKIENFVLLKEGFSFSAFLFSGLWFLYHKMGREFLLLILLNCAFALLGKILSNVDHFLLTFAFAFMVALNANSWLSENLQKKNYEFAGLIFAENLIDAKKRFVKSFEDQNHAADVFADSLFALKT